MTAQADCPNLLAHGQHAERHVQVKMIIDSHCHLHDAAYDDVRGALARASEHGVWGAVAVGCDEETNARTLELAASNGKSVRPALGFHPDWLQLTDADLDLVEAQVAANHSRLVALGEIGLPWYCLDQSPDAAEVLVRGRGRFRRLLDLAARYDLAVILHAPHGAAATALEALKRRGIERAVFHWHKAPAAVPIESLLVESDGPWPYQGEFAGVPSGPWLVSRVAEEIAKIKRLPVDETMYQIASNTCQLFELAWT